MNAMMVLRGHRADYDAWAEAGCHGWAWNDVEPAFARSAASSFPLADLPERHVLAEAFVHAAQVAGIPLTHDLNAEDNSGVGFVPVSQRRGRRFSVVEGYLDPARRRPNLTVVTGALVTRVLLEGGRALGVAYRLHGEEVEEEALAEREVVLCAGAIGSPHTLQLSGIGPRAQLEAVGIDVAHESPGVGANLLDHLANGLFVKTRRRDACDCGVSGISSTGRSEAGARSRRISARPWPSSARKPIFRRPTSSSSSRPSCSRTRVSPTHRARPDTCRRPAQAEERRDGDDPLSGPRGSAGRRPAIPLGSRRGGHGDAPVRLAAGASRPCTGTARELRRERAAAGRARSFGR